MLCDSAQHNFVILELKEASTPSPAIIWFHGGGFVIGSPGKYNPKNMLAHSSKSITENIIYCNCNYIVFTKLPWPGDSEGTFQSSSQAATCPPVYHTRRRLHTDPFNAERQAGKL